MALRQPIPEIAEVDLKRVFGDLQTVKAFAPPGKVEFRRGANLAQVVAELDAETAVSLEAAPGAGKSTLLPLELVRGRSRLLVHLFPNRLQAYQCFDHVSNSQSAVTVKYIDDVDEELPVRGIAYMAYATFIARRISGESFADRSSTVLYLDEIHESDAYTYTVRRLARTMADVGLVVFASATDTPTGFRKSETAAKLVKKHLPACSSPDIWDPREVGQPWSISSLRGNVLIITDNDHHACKLVADYNDMGALAFRLTARVSVEHFAHIMAELNNKKGPIVVLVADSTFRSAFTFDVSLVLDTCYVSYYEVVDGVLERRSRTANVGERYQAAHRAARIAGQDAVYYDIDDEPGNYSVNLEGVEADAAALLFRALGYQPPAEIMASAMAIGRFPIDLTGTLNDMQPVVLVAGEHFTTGFEFQHQTEGAPLPVNSLGIGMMADGVRESKSMEDINRAIDECDVSSAPEGFRGVLNFIHAEPEEAFNPETGRYYTVSGIPAKPRCTASFPRGLDSVIKLMSHSRNPQVVVDHMTMDDRADALSLLLMRYNTATAELRAVSALLRSLPGEAIDAVHHREVKQWVSDTLEAAHSLDITVATVADSMQWFGRYYFFRPYDDMPDVEAHYAEVHKQKLAQFVNLNETDASDYKQQLHGILKHPGRKRVKFSGADARTEQQQSVVATRTSRSSSSTSGGSLTEIGDKMRAPMPRWTGIRYAEAEVVGTKRDKKGNIVREIAVTNRSKNLWGDFMSAVVNGGNKRYITKS